MRGQIVFQLDTGDFLKRPDHEREAIKAFLRAHNIPPERFILGDASIHVRIGPDGGLWLDTWRAVTGEDGKTIRCEHCPGCVRQERVEVPLAQGVPLVEGAFYSRDLPAHAPNEGPRT